VTSTNPAKCAGELTVIDVADAEVILAVGTVVLPNAMVSLAFVAEKPVPVMVTDVAPAGDPEDGETEVTEGATVKITGVKGPEDNWVPPPADVHVLVDHGSIVKAGSDRLPSGVAEVVVTSTVNVAVLVPKLS
jgi:hypothetical protein